MINKEINEIWQDDIKEKKQNAIFHKARTGSKGSSGSRKGMRTPYDYMSASEKRKLNGKVEVKNMFDLLLSKEEFTTYPEEKQTEIMTHWRTKYSNAQIMDSLEIHSPGQFNTLIEKLKVPKKNTWKRTPRTGTKKEAAAQKHSSALPLPVREKMDTPIIDGLSLNYHGSYTADQLSKIWTKLQLLTEGEENSYSVSITVQEKKE